MMVFIKNYVEGCATCQQMKVNTHPTMPPLSPIKSTSTRPKFALVSTYFITDLPEIDGFDSIMVVVDHGLTKGVILIPCSKKIDALATADLYLDQVYKRFGLPDKIISDHDPRFASQLYQKIGRLLGVKLAMSTAYHPQTDGETECMNQELETYLRIYCLNHPESWKQLLPTAEFAHNHRTHSTQKQSPFYLMMGYKPLALPVTYPKSDVPAAEKRIAALQRARDEALATHELARQLMAERITRGFTPFKKGEKVWLEAKNLRTGFTTRKLTPRREGPFAIEKVITPLAYQLKLPVQWRIHPVFHATLLSWYRETDVHGPNYLPPPPDLIDGQEEHEVEVLLFHKKWGKSYVFLVNWKGYPSSENSWEPEQNLTNTEDLLSAYKELRGI